MPLIDLPYQIINPTDAEKMVEFRIYFVVRRDLPISAGTLAKIAAEATCRTLELAAAQAPERYAGYHVAAQPKIALRAKGMNDMARALEGARAFPHVIIPASDGTPLFLAFGPAIRAELPKFLQQLQVLGGEVPAAPAVLASSTGTPAIWLFVRKDAGIPYGKLAAQAGHGAWKAFRTAEPALKQAWIDGGYPVQVKLVEDEPAMHQTWLAAQAAGQPTSYIIDAGRTHFNEPTATVVGIGPTGTLPAGIAPFSDFE